MLDKRMIYSCAYWKDAETLDDAQQNKLDLIAQKLQLKPGMKVLDIGCGWGGAIHYLAEHHGVSGAAVTNSVDQHKAAQELCAIWKDLECRDDQRPLRMWRYYLLSFAGVFRSGISQLWQVVFSDADTNTGHIR